MSKKHKLRHYHVIDHNFDPRKCPFEVGKTYKTVGGWEATVYRIATYNDGISMEVWHDNWTAPRGEGGYYYHKANGEREIPSPDHKLLL